MRMDALVDALATCVAEVVSIEKDVGLSPPGKITLHKVLMHHLYDAPSTARADEMREKSIEWTRLSRHELFAGALVAKCLGNDVKQEQEEQQQEHVQAAEADGYGDRRRVRRSEAPRSFDVGLPYTDPLYLSSHAVFSEEGGQGLTRIVGGMGHLLAEAASGQAAHWLHALDEVLCSTGGIARTPEANERVKRFCATSLARDIGMRLSGASQRPIGDDELSTRQLERYVATQLEAQARSAREFAERDVRALETLLTLMCNPRGTESVCTIEARDPLAHTALLCMLHEPPPELCLQQQAHGGVQLRLLVLQDALQRPLGMPGRFEGVFAWHHALDVQAALSVVRAALCSVRGFEPPRGANFAPLVQPLLSDGSGSGSGSCSGSGDDEHDHNDQHDRHDRHDAPRRWPLEHKLPAQRLVPPPSGCVINVPDFVVIRRPPDQTERLPEHTVRIVRLVRSLLTLVAYGYFKRGVVASTLAEGVARHVEEDARKARSQLAIDVRVYETNGFGASIFWERILGACDDDDAAMARIFHAAGRFSMRELAAAREDVAAPMWDRRFRADGRASMSLLAERARERVPDALNIDFYEFDSAVNSVDLVLRLLAIRRTALNIGHCAVPDPLFSLLRTSAAVRRWHPAAGPLHLTASDLRGASADLRPVLDALHGRGTFVRRTGGTNGTGGTGGTGGGRKDALRYTFGIHELAALLRGGGGATQRVV